MTTTIAYDVDSKPVGVEIYQGNNWIMVPTGQIKHLLDELCWKFEHLDPEEAQDFFKHIGSL